MDFPEPVTLLHFTPLNDEYHYSYLEATENLAAQTPSPSNSIHSTTAASDVVGVPPPYGSYLYNTLQQQQQGPYHSQHSSLQHIPNSSPGSLGMTRGYETTDMGMMIDNGVPSHHMADLGGQPNILPCSERSNPSKESFNTYPGSKGSSSLGPQSPLSVVDNLYRKGYIKSSHRNRSKNPHSMLVRASSPIFPDQSTPLSTIDRYGSISNITSLKVSDKFNTHCSVKSDPGIYTTPIHHPGPNMYDSAINSPTVASMDQGSPFDFSTANIVSRSHPVDFENSLQSFLELEVPIKYSRKVSEIDKKIMKLQVERSKILEKVHHANLSSMTQFPGSNPHDMDIWFPDTSLEEHVGKVYLYVPPIGIQELDEPLYSKANDLLRKLGGLYTDLQAAIKNFRRTCFKGMYLMTDITACFAHMKSLLSEKQKLSLSKVDGIYNIQLNEETPLMGEFIKALDIANGVLRCAQHITLSHTNIQSELQVVRQLATEKLGNCDFVCQRLGVVEREKTQIHAVMEGSCTTIASAEKVWPQVYQAATETISTIVECIHPSMPHTSDGL